MAGPLKYDIDVTFYETKWVDCSWCLNDDKRQLREDDVCPYCGGKGKTPGDKVPINLPRRPPGHVLAWCIPTAIICFWIGSLVGAWITK